jgi:hypothetical protein
MIDLDPNRDDGQPQRPPSVKPRRPDVHETIAKFDGSLRELLAMMQAPAAFALIDSMMPSERQSIRTALKDLSDTFDRLAVGGDQRDAG